MNNVGLFISHMGLGDILLLLPAIKYYAKLCNLLYVCCKDIYIDSAKPFLIEHSNIEIININSKFTAQEHHNTLNEIITTLANKHNRVYLYLSGEYTKNPNTFTDFPIHFYKDLNLDFKETFNNFDVPITDTAKLLFDYAKSIHKQYFFIHSSASNIELNVTINKDNVDILFINPEKNMYDMNHVYYNLANTFLRKDNNYTLIDYALLVQNCAELHVIDSSYFCLAMLCKKHIQSSVKIVYSRYEQEYTSLLDNTWKQYKLS